MVYLVGVFQTEEKTMGDMADSFVRRESKFDRESRQSEQLFKKLSWKLHSLNGVEVYMHRDWEDMMVVHSDTKQPICVITVMDGEIDVSSLDGEEQLGYPSDVSECRELVKSLSKAKTPKGKVGLE